MSAVSTCASCPNRQCKTSPHDRPSFPHTGNSAGNDETTPQKTEALGRYRAEEDRYKAFLVGQTTSEPRSTTETKRDLQRWEAQWQKLAGPGNEASRSR